LDITAFIRELLFSHDCVIVPGFGGFIGNYNPAHIEKSTGTFYPPVKLISFNRNLTHNDGLLIGRISGSAGISYNDAKGLVDDFTADLRRRLANGEKIVFENIGSFVNNHEGNIQFEPDRLINYNLDSYGLESFQCMPLEGYDVRKRVIPERNREPLIGESMRRNLWRAAVIIPLLGLLVAVPLKIDRNRNKIESTTMNPLATAEFEHNRQALDESRKADSLLTVTDAKPSVPEAAPVVEVKPAQTGNANYFLITGSFKSEENAAAQAKLLKEEGFQPEVFTSSNGFYRVCAMSFSDMTAALNSKDSIIKKFPGAWISRKK
jgi:hypothetical protein